MAFEAEPTAVPPAPVAPAPTATVAIPVQPTTPTWVINPNADLSATPDTPTAIAEAESNEDILREFTMCQRLKANKSTLWGQAPNTIYSGDPRTTGQIEAGDYVRILTPMNEYGEVLVQVYPHDFRTVGDLDGMVWIDFKGLEMFNLERWLFECED